jgi:hypothetical protein
MQVTTHAWTTDRVWTPKGAWGFATDISELSGGCSQTTGTASQGARRQCFLTLMMALPDLHQHPQGARRRRFLALMVGAPESLTPPPRGPVVNVFER